MARRTIWSAVHALTAVLALSAAAVFLFLTLARGKLAFDNWLVGGGSGYIAAAHYWIKAAIGLAAIAAAMFGGAAAMAGLRQSPAAARLSGWFVIVSVCGILVSALAIYGYLLPTMNSIYEGWPAWAKRQYGPPNVSRAVIYWTVSFAAWTLWTASVFVQSKSPSLAREVRPPTSGG